MDRRRRTSVIVAAILLAACGSSAPTVAPSAPQGAASPSASPGAESAPPIATGPAWTAVLGQIDADGRVSRDTALQAFALASGVELPGVTPPAGEPGTIASGTTALRWLGSYWGELTTEQRAAAIEAMPELAGLERTSSAPTANVAAFREAQPATGFPGSAQHRTNAYYTQLANLMAADIGPRLDGPLKLTLAVDAHFGLTKKADSGMETGVFDTNGGATGPAAKCVIVVSWLGDAQAEKDVDLQMAHEVWHCFEGQIVGPAKYWSQGLAPWVQEGEAEWVGNSVVPDAPLGAQAYWDYFFKPDVPLFSRTYDGVGFYAHLNDAGVDPWGKLVPILDAKSNAEAFTAAGAETDPFLATWASSLLRDAGRPAAWQMTGPALPDEARAKPVDIHLSNGGSVGESAAAYANEIAVFGESPDVLLTTFSGGARLSDAAGHDYLADDGDGTFCMLPSGCECPGATADEPPMLALDGADVALGVTGGPKGSSGTLTGTKLDDYCNKSITGTWDGTAEVAGYNVANDFTMTLVQRGSSFKGPVVFTGPNCIHQADVTGTVSGGKITMQWALAGLNPVNFEGTLSGKKMSGTFTAIGCPPANLNIGGPWSATKRK